MGAYTKQINDFIKAMIRAGKHPAHKTTTRDTCPECRGKGQYVGLNVVETCDKCLGRGYIDA